MDLRLLQRYLQGEVTEEERREVYEWIRESDDHLARYQSMRFLQDQMLWEEGEDALAQRPSRMPRAWGYILSCAASLALFILGSALYRNTRPAPPEQLAVEAVTAPAGKTVDLRLADGTAVALNANSTLRILPSGKEGRREVYLDGEAYFSVARDEKRPFLVHTDQLSIKVLGTEFNLNASDRGERWEVALASGAIDILDREGQSLTSLTPGVQATLCEGRIVKTAIRDNTFLWKEGILAFENETLGEILQRLSEYYGIRFDTSACRQLDRRYTGKFRANDGYEHILKVLQVGHRFTYDFKDTPEGINILIQS